MNPRTRAPGFRLPPVIPVEVIRYFYTVLSDHAYRRAVYILLAIGIATGITGIYTSATIPLVLVSTIGVIAGLYSFFYDFFKPSAHVLMISHETEQLIKKLNPSSLDSKHGYISIPIPYRNDVAIMSRETNRYLRNYGNTISITLNLEKEYTIKERIKNNSNLFRDVLVLKHRNSRNNKKMFFNDEKLGLASNIYPGIKSLECYKTNYFTSFLTNDLTTFDIEDHTCPEEPSIVWKGIEHFPYEWEHKNYPVLRPLNRSQLSNHIGGNTIGVSSDNLLCLWRQGTTAQRSEGLLAPTGSGSLDWQDFVTSNKTLSDLMIRGVERELHEESARSGSILSHRIVADTKLLGYYRWCGKGGLPGFLAVSRLEVASDTLQANRSEVQNPQELVNSYPAGNLAELTESIEKILALPNVSVPLYINLICLKDTIEEEPAFLDFLFG